jgi:major membrane immunogen (membrane-anchored lipoprotein)
MKKVFIFMLVVCMGFVSCGSDDDDTGNVGNTNVLNGQWIVTESDYAFSVSDVWNFENGNFTHLSRSYHEKTLGTYTIDSESQTVTLVINKEYQGYGYDDERLGKLYLQMEIKDGKIYSYKEDGSVSSVREYNDSTDSHTYTRKYTYVINGNILQFILAGGSKGILTRQ